LQRAFGDGPLRGAIEPLRHALAVRAPALLHGDLPSWRAALQDLPILHAPALRADGAVVTGTSSRSPEREADGCGGSRAVLHRLGPWRKGPFQLDGVDIDAEWRADRKWDRLAPHLAPLDGRRVLDVGSGSGYHLWRMHAAGAAAVLGIEPMLLFDTQFRAVARYAPFSAVQQLPLRLQDLAGSRLSFDTVFSMGVLYHAKQPLDHLAQLGALLRPGGQLVLDTLVLPDIDPTPGLEFACEGASESASGVDRVMALPGRYAGMRNIDQLPSLARLHRWLASSGFTAMRSVSMARTGIGEQRATAWSGKRSLADVLMPDDPTRTLEGHPAPCRAIMICERPVTV